MPQHHLVFFSKFPKSYQKLFSNSWGNIGFLWLAGGFSGEQKWAIYNKISFDWGPQDKKGPGKIKTRSPFWARARAAHSPGLLYLSDPFHPEDPFQRKSCYIPCGSLWQKQSTWNALKFIEKILGHLDSWWKQIMSDALKRFCVTIDNLIYCWEPQHEKVENWYLRLYDFKSSSSIFHLSLPEENQTWQNVKYCLVEQSFAKIQSRKQKIAWQK